MFCFDWVCRYLLFKCKSNTYNLWKTWTFSQRSDKGSSELKHLDHPDQKQNGLYWPSKCEWYNDMTLIWHCSQYTYIEIYIYIYKVRNKGKMKWMKEWEVKNKDGWIYRTVLINSMCKESRCHRLTTAIALKCLMTFDLLTLFICLKNSGEAEFLRLSVISHGLFGQSGALWWTSLRHHVLQHLLISSANNVLWTSGQWL